MSYINEYLKKKLTVTELEDELMKLIKQYNEITGKHLLIYSVDFKDPELPISMDMEDFFTIKDILRDNNSNKLSFYIETPGGEAETAEEIALLLRKKYKYIEFIIVGECKSAGTILTMCGDEIFLNDTGSLGPIDAQIQTGKYFGSAHDYMKWIEEKIDEINKIGKLNAIDSIIISQITPEEIIGVKNSLLYGEELVIDFLKNYKFKNWKVTETTNTIVDDSLKEKRAKEIASKLSNHSLWKSHSRPLKIDTLRNELNLKVENLHEIPDICEIIERIQIILRLIFSFDVYKIIADENTKVEKTAKEYFPTNLE